MTDEENTDCMDTVCTIMFIVYMILLNIASGIMVWINIAYGVA